MTSSRSDVAQFYAGLRERQRRLSQLAGDPGARSGGQRDELAAEVAAWGDDLQVAEEELRVQSEELAAVRLELETLTARNEALNADRTADVITDRNGIVVEANRAAQQLFDRPDRPTSRTSFPMWFAEPDRSRIRSLISGATEAGRRRSAQVSLPGNEPAGDATLTVSVELRVEPHTGAALLCWALTPAGPEDSPAQLRLMPDGQLLPTDPDDAVSRVLSLARADLAAQVSADAAPDTWLARVLELAVRWVPGAEQASLCQVPGRGKLRILAATDDRALACDKIQRDTGQGPTFAATAEHSPVHVDDLAQERRWRLFTEQGRDLGIRSILTCELPLTRGGPATLNLYSTQPGAFTTMAELIAPVFAARASIALGHVDEVQHLHRAIESRQTIGQALGILVERHRLTPEQAFEILVDASKTTHIKLRDLAARISDTGEDPRDITP